MTATIKTEAIKPRLSIQSRPELESAPEHFEKIQIQKRPSPTADTQVKKKIRIAPCNWASKLLHSALLILYWLTIVFAQDFQTLDSNSGFYVERLGQTQIKRGNLRLQLTLTLEEVLQDQKMINTTCSQIQNMCQQTKELTATTHCDMLFRHMSSRKANLLMATDGIVASIQHQTRRRRGVLGNILTAVFGVNDEVYTDIQTLQRNQQDLLEVTNQQSLLLNTKINQSNNVIWERLKQFDSRLTQVVASVNQMKNWYFQTDHNRISIEVVSTYISAEDYYNEIENKYNRWLNAIHGHAHLLDFITTRDIDHVIKNTSVSFGPTFSLARTPQMRLDVQSENNALNLHGYLDIVENNIYELIHVTPIPERITNQSFVIADLKASTLAVNYNQQLYFTLDEHELKTSSNMGTYKYLCSPTMVHSIEESPSCIIDQIYARHASTQCEFHRFQLNGTIWKALMMKSTWLYVTTHPRIVAVVCRGIRTELRLNYTGIIRLKDNCLLKTKEVTLKSTISQGMDVITSYVKEGPLQVPTFHLAKPPLELKAGMLLRPGEQLTDHTSTPVLPHLKSFQRSLVVHSTISTSGILITLIIAILTYRHRKAIKRCFTFCRLQGQHQQVPRQVEQQTASQISQHFDRVLASVGPQHVQT